MASETLYESMCAREQVRVKGFVASLWSLLVVLQLVLEVYERVYFRNSKVIFLFIKKQKTIKRKEGPS